MHAFAVILSLTASVLAYQVTSPNGSQGWSTAGGNNITWVRVSTDPTNFTVALTNTDRGIMPLDNQILLALVDGTIGTTAPVNPPSGGWPIGKGFRVNLVKDEQSVNTIYAQSDQFEIKAPTSSSTPLTVPTQPANTAINNTPSPTPTDAGDSPVPSSNGATRFGVGTTLMGLVALVGAVLA